MRTLVLVVVALSVLSACAQTPKIAPLLPDVPHDRCDQLFLSGRWQLHHLIDATVRGRSMGQLTGVSVISVDERSIDCALMTIEGMVLFSARYDGQLSVLRAVAPFDRPGFAQGLVQDLMLMFFKPLAPLQAHGRTAGGESVCRYGFAGGAVTDIILKDSEHWAVLRYNSNGRRQRTVEAEGPAATHTPARHLTIQSHGRMEYDLKLKLLEALPLDQ